MLVFARTCVTLLQTLFAFHDMGGREASTEQRLEMGIFVLTLVKIVATYAVRIAALLFCMCARISATGSVVIDGVPLSI